MWTPRPYDPGKIDPFGRKSTGNGGPLVTESFKCPTCASNIFYQPELQGMVCRNCGNIYDPSTLEKMGSFGYSIEHDYSADSDIAEEDRKRHEIVCSSCGAVMIANENMMSTMCAFCGSPTLIKRRMTREFKPDYIVPFKIGRETAENNIREWTRTRKMTPKGFDTKSRIINMMPVYVPFWLLDCAVHSDLYGSGKKNGGETSVRSKAKYYVKGVPFDASLKIANKLMEAIEPFDYSEMVKFDDRYLQGFYADKYDQTPFDMLERFVKRLDRMSLDMSKTVAAKYDAYKSNSGRNFTWLSDIDIKYCLLPVWFVALEFNGNIYRLAVNGQTGEAGGRAPTADSVGKLDSLIILSEKIKIKPLIFAAAILPFPIAQIVFSGNTSLGLYCLFWVLLIIEILLLVFLISMFVLRAVAKRASKKIHSTVDAVNDFDKAPGLESYLDTTQHTKINVEDYLFHYELNDADQKEKEELSDRI